MAQPIYKVWMFKPKDAWYKLSPEEQQKLLAKSEEALKKVGGERMIVCYSSWCSEAWVAWGVEKFPDIEAAMAHGQLLLEANQYQYIDGLSYLGTEVPST
jgi:hypothetical protein